MGLFHEPVEFSSLDEQVSLQLNVVVDTGSFYTVLPRHYVQALRVEPLEFRDFELADGQMVNMEIGHAWVKVGDRRIITIIASGRNEGAALLGAYALEGLALAVDPKGEQLVPRQLLLR